MASSQSYSVNLNINANAGAAKQQLKDLQSQLQQISNMKIDIGTGSLTADIEKASQAAMKLSAHLATATNPQTGNLDFTKFYTSIQKSGASLQEYGQALQNMGPAGQKAFVSLADSISKSEIPLRRTSKLVDGMWDNLKKTIGWQISSSMIHGFIGSVQQAMGYAKDLNKSLTDIRIVTGQSSDQMATFAREANKAAKSLSTTTTDYTKASLIYYQQGLSDQEVKARTETTIKMANATGTSAQKVSDQMTAIWNNYDNGTKSLTHYADVMTALGAATASSTDEIAQGLQKFASISDTVGLSYEYAASALATITSTSRESADVVGNSLKTLFSRIQGLQLGETLDDGTTLNKYSTALAKVGISIKDSSGELKDMDNILDEMGTKWQTLASDEKMALAQTVAGVRQYTQLMTLMENWDQFKQNLNIANTSAGTLDQQAAIYAESWEAASNRVRASWEGLWDTMINSDSMITMLDGLSGIIGAMDTLTASMGGAGGVLTSFLGIATKLFAPKLSQGLRDTAYNVAMLFGGEQKIKEARNTVLDKALKTLDTDGEFGDLYGQNEAEARKAAMKSQIQASLDYAENYNNMTPLQHQIEQQYANATRAQDQRTVEAGAILDNAKNARYDAWANLTHTDVGQSVDNLLNFNRHQIADMAVADIKAANQRKELTRDEFLQRQQAAQRFKDSTSKEKTASTTGDMLSNFSTALTEFYKKASGPDAGKATNYLDNLKTALDNLEESGYKDDNSKKIMEKMRAKINGATEGIALDFTDDYQQLIARQGKLAGGSEFGNFFTAWLEKEFNVGKAAFEYETEKQRGEKLRSGRENNLDGTKNIDWADAMVGAGEGALLALSAGQSLLALTESLNDGTADAISSITSIVSTITQVSMAFASFKTILKGVGMAASKVNWVAMAISAALTVLPSLFNFLDNKIVNEEERIAQQAKTQSELNNAYQQAENRHQNLIKSIDTYGKAQDALAQLTDGTTEWTNSLYEANKTAMNIISANNLTEGKDYYRDSNGLLKINQSTLNNIEKASETSLDTIEAASRLKQLDSVENNKENLSQELLTEFSNHPIWDILDKQNSGETLSEEEQSILNSKRLDGNHFMIDDGSYSRDIISAITTAYLKNSGILDSTESIYEALVQKGYSGVSDIVVDSIYEMRNSIKASTTNIQEQYESEAREFLSKESYKNEEQVMAASGRLLMNEYNKVKENYDKNYEAYAWEYAKSIGLTQLDGFRIGLQDAQGNIKYSYKNANGDIVNDTMDKGAVQQYQIASKTLENLETSASKLDSIFTSLNESGTDADNAMIAFIAENNFGKASLKEMTDLSIKGLQIYSDTISSVASLMGISADNYTQQISESLENQKIESEATANRIKLKMGGEISADGKSINLSEDPLGINDLNTNNLISLDRVLTNISATKGKEGIDSYISSLGELLTQVDDVDKNNFLEMLLNMDAVGSSADNLSTIQAIIESLGGSFDSAASAAQSFAEALAGISVNNLNSLLSQFEGIKNAISDIYQLKSGANISEELYENIIKAVPELKDYFARDLIGGGYNYSGSAEIAKDAVKNKYLESGEQIQQNKALKEAINKESGGSMEDINGDSFTIAEWAKKQSDMIKALDIETSKGGSQGREIDDDGIFKTLKIFDNIENFGDSAVQAIIDQSFKIKSSQGEKTISSAEDIAWIESQYANLVTQRELLFKDVEDKNEDGTVDRNDLEADQQVQYDNLTADIEAFAAVMTQIMSYLADIMGTDWEGKASEFESEKGSLASGTDDLASMYNIDQSVKNKMSAHDYDGFTMQSNEDLRNYASGLADLGSNYEYSAEMANKLKEAMAEGNYALAESLLAETEMATAIAATAEARGIDAEQLAYQMDLMEKEGQFQKSFEGDTNGSAAGGAKIEDMSPEMRAKLAADAIEEANAMQELTKSWDDLKRAISGVEGQSAKVRGLQKLQDLLSKIGRNTALAAMSASDFEKAYSNFINKYPNGMSKILKGDRDAINAFEKEASKVDLENMFKQSKAAKESGKTFEEFYEGLQELATASQDTINQMNDNQSLGDAVSQGVVSAEDAAALEANVANMVASFMNLGYGIEQACALTGAQMGIEVHPKPTEIPAETQTKSIDNSWWIPGPHGTGIAVPLGTTVLNTKEEGGTVYGFEITKLGDAPSGGGGGGGGGGGKEPKKVANKRKSQTVQRYKKIDFKRDLAEKSSKSEENKKDYLYGESKIAQMEKINKLAEKEARITADRISESREYLVEDRQNLIKYMQKYGFEAEFDSDGFLASYEEAWTKVYEEIAALYEDNELTEEEEEIEEELNIKLEELEGALEDYENSLKELSEDIEKYEESLYTMYDSKLDQLEHRLEFRLELNEDDMSYIDFLIESLGDNAFKAVDRISLITKKSTALFDNIVRVKENIQAIYDLSDDPFQMWATGGLDIDGLLTEAQVEQLREHRDQLIDYMQELLGMRETIQEEVLNVFDAWNEKIDHNISAIDHYTNVLEHFKNVIDITGKDVFGMSDSFMRSIESAVIDQSMDSIEANKSYYESLVQANVEAEQALQEARARGDIESEEHWEEVVRSTSESMQSAQDALLSALENTLTMISDQFTVAMEDVVEQFNKSIYASGGLEGLSNDYSLLREQADLMAEDYDKIYNLTKLTRNINKTLDDTNIIAGKQRLTKLLQEVNDLQKSGVELSKYDLEYLEAKYNLYLAQIELENAQGNKDTVQLSRDSEGNWSYVYTTNEEKVNKAQQKYEDALYKMQNMNHEYMEEMSSSMIETAQAMSEEIANLQISDFANLEEYNNKVQEIREKYEQSLNLQNEELNKVIDNNESLYETDWQNYSKYTGYKISADKDWIDSFRETTLGHLMGSESVQSDFNQTIIGLTDTLAQSLSDAAVQYFTQMNTALQAYGSSIDGFSGHIVSMTNTVKEQSDEAAKATESMGKRMEDAFSDVVTAVKEWQEIEAPKIEEELEAIKTLIEEINESIRTSAELTTDKDTSIIGSSKAIELINDSGLFGSWKINERGDINVSDGTGTETTNFVDYNAKLLEELDDAIELHANGRISDDALAEMFKRYWAYKDIVNRIYDTTNIDAEKELEEKEKELEKKLGGSIKFDTGGYTGEWGNEGKIAMLHEKELVLNANDTSNFLEALNISRQLIEMIEMNARASSLGLGEMVASTIKDTSQTIEQKVSITAEFPNATDHSEIEEAFDNLINIASQYAYRSE